jgi:putative colanic acid biosynthesis glycosyltransferase
MSSRFSVVTVTRNNLAGLKTTAESLRRQSFSSFEWIVVDGASSDGSVAFLSSLFLDNMKLISEPDDGIYDAMNKALDICRGDYVLFLNAGDALSDQTVLGRVDTLILDTRPKIVYGDAWEVQNDRRFYKPARDPAYNRFVMFTHHQAIFYRRDLVVEEKYDLSYRLSADWVMTMRVLKHAGPVAYLREPICFFERGGISQRDDARHIFDAELWRVYRQENHMAWTSAVALYFLKTAVNRFRKYFPSVYDGLRYR